MALQTPKFYLAGSKRARKPGFLRSIDRKKPQFEQALRNAPRRSLSKLHGIQKTARQLQLPQQAPPEIAIPYVVDIDL
ncbi:MAG: hypothetical protein LBD18_04025 [Treponema sp.]|nr:hypothetical protein [Treponema sp.]